MYRTIPLPFAFSTRSFTASVQMAGSTLGEIEELTLCSCCKRVFDELERPPKLLTCKHHFCLACARTVLGAGREVYCMHCWKRTELPDGRADNLPNHGAVLALARRLASAAALAPAEPACAAHALPALWCAAPPGRGARAAGSRRARPPGRPRAAGRAPARPDAAGARRHHRTQTAPRGGISCARARAFRILPALVVRRLRRARSSSGTPRRRAFTVPPRRSDTNGRRAARLRNAEASDERPATA